VQASRDFVTFATELSAGVQGRVHHFGCALARVLRMFIDRNTTAIVDDPDASIRHYRDVDPAAVARHRLVNGVVYDLGNEVVQPGGAR
jgi:hypothetical protein